MIAWLDIDADDAASSVSLIGPADRQAAAAATGARVLPLLRSLSAMNRPLSVPGIAAAPVSNMQITLDNADGSITRLWGAHPPMRRAARVMVLRAGVPTAVFSGIVTGLDMGRDARLTLEAGMDRPLSDNLPLRTSAVWGGWRDVQTLPWVWGRATVTPIQYADDQRLYVLADHPCQAVDEVKRDDVATSAFAFYNGVDSTGRAVAFLELAEPLAEGERLSVTLRGRMLPQTGALLQTPAEIVHDLLANLAGAPVGWADLDEYRTETADVVLGGMLADNTISIRAAVDKIIQSAGGAWSAAMPGIALTWPPAADDAAPATRIDTTSANDLQAATTASAIRTVLRVLYDWDDAQGRYRRAVQLRAPEAVRSWGELELEWAAPWLRTPRQAEALGRRMLAQLARPRWRVTWQQAFADLPTGAWVDVQHPLSPITGRQRLITAELDLERAAMRCQIEAPVGDVPEIETERLSSAFDPLIQPGVTVEIADGEIIFTVRDEQGRVLAGARVTINGGATRIADSLGRVSFAAARGRHVLLIEADGYPPSEAVVVI